MKKNKKTKYQLMMESCPILYQEKDQSCSETCMCWGIEAGEGWLKPLTKLSNALEELNRQYWTKFGVKIVANQVKEKYGTLHFYYDIVPVRSKTKHFLYRVLDRCDNWIAKNVRFNSKSVEIKPETKNVHIEELTLDQYRTALQGIQCSNVEYEVKDGKILKKTEFVSYAVSKYVPTKHKIIYFLKNKLHSWKNRVFYYSESMKQKEIVDILERKADKLIRKAETECYHVCEHCGKEIGTKDSPVCMTHGWISYLCEDCASDRHRIYTKNKEVWQDKVVIKTEAQIEKEENDREEEAHKRAAEAAKRAKEKAEKAEQMLREGKNGKL